MITETNWSGRGDSNSRSPAPKAGALATTLRPEAQGWSLNQISHSDYRPSTFSPYTRGCSSMVEPQPSKLAMPVRSRSPAPDCYPIDPTLFTRALPVKVMFFVGNTALTIPTLTENEVPKATFAAVPMIRNPYCLPDN